MNKKAIYALMLAVVLPVISYFIVKKLSETAVILPRHYFADTVITQTKNGKEITDTFWHKLPDFSLTNQLGRRVSLNDLKGKIIVTDFFFTHCPTICPKLTANMKRMEESITNSEKVGERQPDFIQFLSFSIDPARDSVPALKKWADRFQINPETWWLLTGDKKTIYDISLNQLKLGIVDGESVDTNFMHTDMFVLIDTNRNIRGYYHGLDTMALARLSKDIIYLTLEKDPKKKSFLAGKLELMAVVLLITLIAVSIFFFVFNKKLSATNVTPSLEKE